MASINDLQNDPKNARKRTDRSAKLIKQSLEQYGAARSIVIDENNRILAGNGTIAGAKAAGIKNLKIIEADGDEIIAVKRSNLTEDQKVGLAIADNRTGDLSEWDIDMLEQLSKEHDLNDFFDKKELDDILSKKEVTSTEGLTDPDDVPEVPEEPITKEGDLYILGNHRLLCGDSTNILHVEKLMDGNKADMVFTDPPYNIDYGNIKHPKFKVRNIQNDNMSSSEFKDFCQSFVSVIKTICDGCVYVFGPQGPDGRIMFSELDNLLHCSTTIIWNKHVFTLGRGKYQNKYEPCWFGWTKSGEKFIDDRTLTNVWDFKRPTSSKLHPTMKPVELIEYGLSHASKKNQIVLDLFGGSGSTLIAAERLKRQAFLMELDPKYCDVIVKRWEDFTGNKAKRVLSK